MPAGHWVVLSLFTKKNIMTTQMSRSFLSFLRIWNLLVGSVHTPTKVQSLRLLTNLSTNEQMTEHVLTPQVKTRHRLFKRIMVDADNKNCDLQIPFGFWSLIDIKTPEEILLRAISLVANLMASDQKKSIMISAVQQEDNLNHTNGQM